MRLSADTQRILLNFLEQAVENFDATQTPISAQCSMVRSLFSEQAELLEQSVRPAERAAECAVFPDKKGHPMKLSPLVYVCQTCAELFERAPQGVCPICQSTYVFSLTRLLSPVEEQRTWARRIGVTKSERPAQPSPTERARHNLTLYLTELE